MVQKPFTDIKLVVRASVKGHVGKLAWVASAIAGGELYVPAMII